MFAKTTGEMRQLYSASSLYELLQEGEWEKAARIIIGPGFNSVLDMSEVTGEPGLNVLHVICRFQPPEEIVEFVLNKCPSLAQEKDARGRYPLHYASGHGSRSAVVKSLLSENAAATMQADNCGRLPLHLACQPRRWQPDDYENKEALYMQPGSAVIMALCKTAPASTNVEDNDGYNALEIAIEFDLSYKICQVLMETSDKAWKDMTKENEDWEKRKAPVNEAQQRRMLRDLPSYEDMLNRWHEEQLSKKATRRKRGQRITPKELQSVEKPSKAGQNEVKVAAFAAGPVNDSYRATVRSTAA
jgi:hypothetical protein